jgi:hypothetical protein
MHRLAHYTCRLLLLATLLTLLASRLAAAPSGALRLDWWTIDGGGGSSQSAAGELRLSGTIGQPDAGMLSGGDLSLRSGFWTDAKASYTVFIPLILQRE